MFYLNREERFRGWLVVRQRREMKKVVVCAQTNIWRHNGLAVAKKGTPWSRFGHNVRRPEQFVCPNSDKICPNSDKIYLSIVTSKFLFSFRDSSLPSGSWIVLFWLPAKTLSLKRLHGEAASSDEGLTISPLVNTDRKGGAYSIMLQQFRRAIAVTAANGHSQHILQRLHYVRGTEQEARDACRSHHSDDVQRRRQ